MKPDLSDFQGILRPRATLQVQVPAQTKRDLHVRAAMTGEPMRLIALTALAAYGFDVRLQR